MTTIDVTQNAQYTALKQSYDKQIDTDQQVQDLWKDFNQAGSQMGYLDSSTPEWQTLAARYQDDMDKMCAPGMDPSGAIRTQIANGEDPVAQMKQQESDALNALSNVLIGKGDVDKANKDAQGVPPTPPPPINIVINNYGNDGAHGHHRKHRSGTAGDDPDSTGTASGGGKGGHGGGHVSGGGHASGSHHANGSGRASGKDKTAGAGGTSGANGAGGASNVDGGDEAAGTEEDIMTRALMVMAKLGNSCDGCTNGFMDQLTGSCDTIDDLNKSSQVVRAAKPTDTSAKTGTISAAAVQDLQKQGVQLPDDVAKMTPDASGNFTIPTADFDTLSNNIQSASSSLTTMNQNTTISMNKAIDASQQCSTFQASDLEKWAQLMSKILS